MIPRKRSLMQKTLCSSREHHAKLVHRGAPGLLHSQRRVSRFQAAVRRNPRHFAALRSDVLRTIPPFSLSTRLAEHQVTTNCVKRSSSRGSSTKILRELCPPDTKLPRSQRHNVTQTTILNSCHDHEAASKSDLSDTCAPQTPPFHRSSVRRDFCSDPSTSDNTRAPSNVHGESARAVNLVPFTWTRSIHRHCAASRRCRGPRRTIIILIVAESMLATIEKQRKLKNVCTYVWVHILYIYTCKRKGGWKGGKGEGLEGREREREGKREKREKERTHVTRHNTNETDDAGPWEALTAG